MIRPYDFLVETFESERLKTLSVWAQFRDADLDIRPREGDRRGRTPREQMIHQFVSEGGWFRKILGVQVDQEAPPSSSSRVAFIEAYATGSGLRAAALADMPPVWWEEHVAFFDVRRSRAWVVVRRIAHTAHHRGQLTALLRVWGRPLHSTYGPTADTGGLPVHAAPTIYPYSSIQELLASVRGDDRKRALPPPAEVPVTEVGES